MKTNTRTMAAANNPLGHTPELNPPDEAVLFHGFTGNPVSGSRMDATSKNNPWGKPYIFTGQHFHPIGKNPNYC